MPPKVASYLRLVSLLLLLAAISLPLAGCMIGMPHDSPTVSSSHPHETAQADPQSASQNTSEQGGREPAHGHGADGMGWMWMPMGVMMGIMFLL